MEYGWLMTADVEKQLKEAEKSKNDKNNKEKLRNKYKDKEPIIEGRLLALTINPETRQCYTGKRENIIQDWEKKKDDDEALVAIGGFNEDGTQLKCKTVTVSFFVDTMLKEEKKEGEDQKYWVKDAEDGRTLLYIEESWFEGEWENV
jgi:hypothetical protein